MSRFAEDFGWAVSPDKIPENSYDINKDVGYQSALSAGKNIKDIYGDYTQFPEYKALKEEIKKKGWLTVSEVAAIIEDYSEYDEVLAAVMMMTILNGG